MVPRSTKKTRLLLAVTSLLVVGTASFLIGRQLSDRGRATAQDVPAAVASPVSDAATPVPGSTPDRSLPNWYVPYLNQDRELPKFSGTINGILIGDAARTATGPSACATTPSVLVGDEATTALLTTELAIPQTSLSGVKPSAAVVVTTCAGQVVAVEQHFDALAGAPGVNSGGAAVTITRNRGGTGTNLQAPAGRWTAGTVSGHPAVLLAPVIDTVGTSAVVIAFESGSNSDLTLLQGAGVMSQFLAGLAEELFQ